MAARAARWNHPTRILLAQQEFQDDESKEADDLS